MPSLVLCDYYYFYEYVCLLCRKYIQWREKALIPNKKCIWAEFCIELALFHARHKGMEGMECRSSDSEGVKIRRDLCALLISPVRCREEETEAQRVREMFPKSVSSLLADADLEARLVVPWLYYSQEATTWSLSLLHPSRDPENEGELSGACVQGDNARLQESGRGGPWSVPGPCCALAYSGDI